MNKRKKIIILTISLLIIGISTVYASTLIRASDVIYDNSKSGGNSNNVQGALDELYDKKSLGLASANNVKLINENMISYIKDLAQTDTVNLAYDDTSDKNLRYIGNNPNNYVSFNGELWRIIGIMKDGVKLIRSEAIGTIQWNTSNTNDWSTASSQKLLNSGDYFNRSGNYSSNGLTSEAKTMINSVTWNLGGATDNSSTAKSIYASERGTSVYSGRPTTWKGYVGLMYPSDYGYAVGGSARSTCLAKKISAYNTSTCTSNNWLYKGYYLWTITPVSDSYRAFSITSDGYINYGASVNGGYRIYPTVFLNSSLLITRGEGTEAKPYVISFEEEIRISVDTSNASPPKLDEEGKLIPVTLANDGKVTVVSEEDSSWYNYSEKQWANAVILTDSPSKTYKEGDVISESDIESYFVWIPKYKYRLWNTGTASKNAHDIDIIFDTKNTTDKEGVSCKTPMMSGATDNCNNGEYMTHPAFISLGVDGFWVGKFETGYKGATSTSAAQVSSADSSKIIIKPNVYSWMSSTIYNVFTSSYNYERTLESHMIKNTEWGAVAYLSHSKYGIGYEINSNNNSSYKTGYSALLTLDQHTYPGTYGDGSNYNQPYNTSVGYLASTTGNITGIYDMNGGAIEFMASYVDGNYGKSGFTSSNIANYDKKYFDIYSTSSTDSSWQYRILGDATGEMGPFLNYKENDNVLRYHNTWYRDDSAFVSSTQAWFHRSGGTSYGVLSGQFYFHPNSGSGLGDAGSRIVLSP